MNSYLPPDGQYIYTVTIFPGNINVTSALKGDNIIQSQCEAFTAEGYGKGFAAGVGTGIGVTVAVLVILLVTAVLWAWRRNWNLPCAHTEDGKKAEFRSSTEDDPGSPHYLESPGNTYDALYKSDVGAKSPYASLNVVRTGETANKSTSARIRNMQP